MDSPDDDKRRVMTPPDEWTGNASDDDLDPLAGDTSWLDDSDLPPAPDIDDEPAPDSDAQEAAPPAPETPETAAAPADAAAEDPDTGWLEDSQPEEESATDSSPADDAPLGKAPMDEAPLGGGDTDWLEEEEPDTESAQPAAEPPTFGDDPITVAARTAEAAAEDTAPAAPTPPPASESPEPSPEAILTDHHAVARPPSGNRSALLLATVAVALLGLLATGGWLVYEDRTGLQARIAELESRPAPKARSDQSEQLRQLEADKAALADENAALQQRLDDANAEIAGLRASLAEAPQVAAATVAEATPEPSTPSPSPAESTPTEAKAEAPTEAPRPETSTTGRWFVNVVSYNRRSTAERWLKRIQQDVDRAVLQESEMMDKPLLRIRAIGYSSMADAKAVAGFLEDKYDLAPLWVGTLSADELARFNNPSRDDEPVGTTTDADASTDETEEPLAEGDSDPGVADGGWFIYVDTYTDGVEADERAQQINNAGYEAKVAVEYNGGDLFYRLQVVGIPSREEGERITAELAGLGGMPNLQLRQY